MCKHPIDTTPKLGRSMQNSSQQGARQLLAAMANPRRSGVNANLASDGDSAQNSRVPAQFDVQSMVKRPRCTDSLDAQNNNCCVTGSSPTHHPKKTLTKGVTYEVWTAEHFNMLNNNVKPQVVIRQTTASSPKTAEQYLKSLPHKGRGRMGRKSPSKSPVQKSSPAYAGAKFSEPPSPNVLPKPPVHWMNAESNSGLWNNCAEITNVLKVMLKVQS
ncbi:hypothetical protein LSAT2_025601 [Lamellibrachia satsuma]|nr:hypothetical protein LSAT2_025601 [Lamellibrachia satsuma]